MQIDIGEESTNAICTKYKEKLGNLLINHQATTVLHTKSSAQHMLLLVDLCARVEEELRKYNEVDQERLG